MYEVEWGKDGGMVSGRRSIQRAEMGVLWIKIATLNSYPRLLNDVSTDWCLALGAETVTQLEGSRGNPPARWAFQACPALNFSTCEQVFTVLKMC
jgi:hypothetical protein